MFRLTDLGDAIAATPDEPTRLRLVFEFLRWTKEDGHPLLLLVAREPQPLGDVRFDALLAAVAEDLCVRAGIRPPAWVHRDERFLHGLWWVADRSGDRLSPDRLVDRALMVLAFDARVPTPTEGRRVGPMR